MHRPHYAWFVCLGGALALFVSVGLGVNVFTIYQPEILRVNDFTNAQGSWITTTRSLFILAALLTVNQLCARLGLRLVMTLGMALLALSCLCFGLADSFPMYCAAAALTGLGYCYGGMVPLSLAIGHWFRDRRSLALGLASAGSGVSTILAPAPITWAIRHWGLDAAFLCQGACILVLGAAVWLLVRDSPEQLGLEPYHLGGAQAPAPAPRPAPAGMTPLLQGGVLLAALLLGGPGGPGFSHLTVLYTTAGYSSSMVAALMSYTGLVICLGKIICGQIYDRAGGRLGNRYIFGTFLAGLLLCCLAPVGGAALPFLAVTLFSLGLPASAVSPSVWAADLFGDAGYETAVRSITVAYTVGMLLLGPVPGLLADRFGSYVPAYALFALCLAAAALLLQGIYRRLGAGRRPAPRG